ncbi:hypothetical protein [Bdellovibrio sp. HCB337]|uniref:hypothetical protein n=1 Tax=Bdellovibrio sp. HCB337 TaxID=3394358 RepID=UPI0039A619A2
MMSLASLVLFTSFSATAALGDICELKQKNAASFTFAQELAAPVQQVEIVEYQEGPWTRATRNNIGSDIVIVRYLSPPPKGPITATYNVSAHQIEDTADCHITRVKRLTPLVLWHLEDPG